MKQNPQLQRIEENMRQGKLAEYRFLGNDNRHLLDIISEDQTTVEQLGLTHAQIAERLHFFWQKGLANLGRPVVIDGRYQVTTEDHKGTIPCPFGDNYRATKSHTKLINLNLGEEICWSALSIHLIEEHGFYEGLGAPFRLDPRDLKRILELG